MQYGRLAKKEDARTLLLDRYAVSLAPPPPSVDLVRDSTALVELPLTTLYPMDGNDTVGDCTIAAAAHEVTLQNAMVKQVYIPTTDEVTGLYFSLTGGPDSGLACLDVLRYLHNNAPWPGNADRVISFVSIDPSNHELVKQACQLFGGVYLGFQVQQNAERDFFAHTPWTSGSLTSDGHCVYMTGYDDTASYHGSAGLLTVLTWGAAQQATWDWWDTCVDEAYALFVPEAVQIDGLDWQTLLADLSALGTSEVPPLPEPTPTPEPPPVPAPTPSPSVLEQILALLDQVLNLLKQL